MSHEYIGNELDLFAKATNWKNYYTKIIKPYLNGNVLEVGAGIGNATAVLCDGRENLWLCLELDATLADTTAKAIQNAKLPKCCEVINGTLTDLPLNAHFNSIYLHRCSGTYRT